MSRIKAFLHGMWEFKLMNTYRYPSCADDIAYEWGREWAHRLTFRYWDN